MTRDGKSITALLFGCMIPAIAFVFFNWRVYSNSRAQVLEGKICPTGDAACLNEMLDEFWLDFLVSASIGFIGLYFATLVAAVVAFVVIDQVRFRVRGSRQYRVES